VGKVLTFVAVLTFALFNVIRIAEMTMRHEIMDGSITYELTGIALSLVVVLAMILLTRFRKNDDYELDTSAEFVGSGRHVVAKDSVGGFPDVMQRAVWLEGYLLNTVGKIDAWEESAKVLLDKGYREEVIAILKTGMFPVSYQKCSNMASDDGYICFVAFPEGFARELWKLL